jgi:hypothetical protein
MSYKTEDRLSVYRLEQLKMVGKVVWKIVEQHLMQIPTRLQLQ